MEKNPIQNLSNEQDQRQSRRGFVVKAVTAASTLALSEFLPRSVAQLTPGGFRPPEIVRDPASKRLRAVLQVKNGPKTIPGVGQGLMMRYFEGYNPGNASEIVPPKNPNVVPGPTLRVRLGDSVQITFVNQVNIADFGLTIDKAEAGGCDTTAIAGNPNWYPMNDAPPNCFHGSSTCNLHFHGTHVSPDGLGDNVLVQIIPDNTTKPGDWEDLFNQIFKLCPANFKAMPGDWWKRQRNLVQKYDATNLKLSKAAGRPLPSSLVKADDDAIAAGQWPQYLIGAYPNCFTITEYVPPPPNQKPKYVMGQAPGTHWYHAHKHGSTSLHLFSGLAGALIIEGPYDDDLRKAVGGSLVENVLVLQQLTDRQNLERATSAGSGNIYVNGQLNPTISMKPGEVQLWRIINATVSKTVAGSTFAGTGLSFKQTAQDGVQFKAENYNLANNPRLSLAPGNRVDLLVQAAPTASGNIAIGTLVTVNVSGSAVNMRFPPGDYTKFPDWLGDISGVDIKTNTVKFGWEQGRLASGRNTSNAPPAFTIDGHQFSEGHYAQNMILGTSEEWKVYNYTSIMHPFHIHVNPFQIVEIFDPNTPANNYNPTKDFVWQDVVQLPPAKKDTMGNLILGPDGFAATPGYIRFRSRFVDFPGSFVLHCHILAHEDRGMMQLVRVIDAATTTVHHH